MRKSKFIHCIDSHTAGEPTRLVIDGLPVIKGNNLKQKTKYFSNKLDNYRSILTGEPRGHAPMHAAIYIPSNSKKSDFGLILMCALGYIDMCGHALIGSITSLINSKKLSFKNSKNLIKIETCAGIITVTTNWDKKNIKSISFVNQKSFSIKEDFIINIPEYGKFTVNFAYGGLWYIIVNSKEIGIKIEKKNLNKLIIAGKKIRMKINSRIDKIKSKIQLPEKFPQTLFFDEINSKYGRNFVTSDELGFDRSPCGTGCCARLALMYSQGKIKEQQNYIQKSIIDTSFNTRIVKVSKNGNILPEITGSAYITGINKIYLDPNDTIKNGFFLYS